MRIFALIFLALTFMVSGCKDNEDGGGTGGVTLPTFTANSVTLFEGDENKNFNFAVNLSQSSEQTVQVNYQTEEGTAGTASDFVATSGTYTFNPGETSGEIAVEIIGDTIREQNEDFTLRFSNIENATLGTGMVTGTIRNDDENVVVNDDGYITPDNYPGYELAWADEFNGTELDENNWTPEIGAGGWGNNEWQYYTGRPENVFLSNGNLIIEAREENYNGSNYTSTRMVTQGNKALPLGASISGRAYPKDRAFGRRFGCWEITLAR